MAFRFCFLQHHLPAVHFGIPFSLPSRTERSSDSRLLQFLSMSSQTLWNLRFSPFSIPENFSHFHFFCLPLVNPTVKRFLFSRLTEQSERILSFSLQHLRCVGPSARMNRLFVQLRTIPRIHIFGVTFYRLPDIQIYKDFLHFANYFGRNFIILFDCCNRILK